MNRVARRGGVWLASSDDGAWIGKDVVRDITKPAVTKRLGAKTTRAATLWNGRVHDIPAIANLRALAGRASAFARAASINARNT